ncbi:hypothetical protein GJ496_007171 [Pomphorhynchus laevis]|nr:hypothetical protein GJ496_007171 [Pomphorhynchus laevis]
MYSMWYALNPTHGFETLVSTTLIVIHVDDKLVLEKCSQRCRIRIKLCKHTMAPSCSSRTDLSKQIPITIITGLLGSGKTTLLRKILSEKHGLRLAVLLNEYAPDDNFTQLEKAMFVGENGKLYEKWVEVNNGCLCCTVKGETEEALLSLGKCKCTDGVIVECSGLANPGPIIHALWSNDKLNDRFKLNGVVTVVDARKLYGVSTLEFDKEFRIQIAYADHIIVNKMDLLQTTCANFDDEECKEICRDNIRNCNLLTMCTFTNYCDVDVVKNVLNLRSYEDHNSVQSKMFAMRSNNGQIHSVNIKNIRCLTFNCPVSTLFKRAKLSELLAELLWNNQEDSCIEGKYGRIRRMKASVIVKERSNVVNRVIVQAVDGNYDEFALPNYQSNENDVSRFVFIGENMQDKAIKKVINDHLSSTLG